MLWLKKKLLNLLLFVWILQIAPVAIFIATGRNMMKEMLQALVPLYLEHPPPLMDETQIEKLFSDAISASELTLTEAILYVVLDCLLITLWVLIAKRKK